MSVLPSPGGPVAASQAPASGPCLLFEEEGGPIRHPVPEGITRIGRSSRNTLALKDATVSRFHCFLSRTGPNVRLYDAGSDNGTRIGNEKAEDGRLLTDGDVLVLGNLKIAFSDPGRPSVQAPEARPAPAKEAKPELPVQAPPRDEGPTKTGEPREPAKDALEQPESRLARPEAPRARPRRRGLFALAFLFFVVAGLAAVALVLAKGERDKERGSRANPPPEAGPEPDAPNAPLFAEAHPRGDDLAREVKTLSEAVAALKEEVRAARAKTPEREDPEGEETPPAGLDAIEKELASLREENARLDTEMREARERNEELAKELAARIDKLQDAARATGGPDGKGEPPGEAKEDPTPSRVREDPPFDPESLSLIERAASWLLSTQADDGSWSLQPDGPGDLATTALAALALWEARDAVPKSSQRAEIEAAFRCAINYSVLALDKIDPNAPDGYLARELGHGVESYVAGLALARAHEGATPNVQRRIRGVLAALAPWIDRLLLSGEDAAPDIRLIGFRALFEIRRSGVALTLAYDLDDAMRRLESSFLDEARPSVLVTGRRYAGEHFLKAYVVADAMANADRTRWKARLSATGKALVGLSNSDGSFTGHEGVTSRSFCTAAALLALAATGVH
ncbi:MAG: FHA domain-containing protein [Planctomycetes bacterium]|nr:FHA domain-containing protein [Planctomycetota bacterium]